MNSQTFADYILSEHDWIKKMEIMYYLNKRGNIFFDNSVVFKTELLKLFLDNTDLGFDKYSENLIKSSTIGARKIASRKESVAETREIPYNNAV